MSGQRFMGDALGYWQGTVESGELDVKEPWDDGTPLVKVFLSEEDLKIIEESLKKRFIQMKRDRTGVLHAVRTIRAARE